MNINHALFNVFYGTETLPAISINNQVLSIGEPCTALRSILAFGALVIASPKKWASKKSALLLLPIIYEANILRIVTLVIVSLTSPALLEIVHIILWREGLIALIIILWVYWLDRGDMLWNTAQELTKKIKALF